MSNHTVHLNSQLIVLGAECVPLLSAVNPAKVRTISNKITTLERLHRLTPDEGAEVLRLGERVTALAGIGDMDLDEATCERFITSFAGAVFGLLWRDKISTTNYNALTSVWRDHVGPIHPDDPDAEEWIISTGPRDHDTIALGRRMAERAGRNIGGPFTLTSDKTGVTWEYPIERRIRRGREFTDRDGHRMVITRTSTDHVWVAPHGIDAAPTHTVERIDRDEFTRLYADMIPMPA